MGDERVDPAQRYGPRTSKAARQLGAALGSKYASPKRIDQFVKDMFGGAGTLSLELYDKTIAPWIESYPNDPAVRIGDRYITGLGAFVKGDAPPYRTKSQQEFYEMLKQSDQVSATINLMKKRHQKLKLKDYVKANKRDYKLSKPLRRVQEKIRTINEKIEIINRSNMSPEKKREQIDKFLTKRNQVFSNIVSKVEKIKEK